MTFTVVYEESAIDQAAGYLDDPDGMGGVFDAVDSLAVDPRPSTSFAFGSDDLRRLRVGRYRVLYEVRGDTVSVGRIARGPASGVS